MPNSLTGRLEPTRILQGETWGMEQRDPQTQPILSKRELEILTLLV